MKKNLILVAMILAATSCKTKKEECTGGDGGAVTVNLFPKHHSKTIYNQPGYKDTVYILYDTQEAPPLTSNLIPTRYDKMLVGSGNEDHVHVSGLKCGDYYFYMTGIDTTGPYRVTGGVPFSTDKVSGSVDFEVPVTE